MILKIYIYNKYVILFMLCVHAFIFIDIMQYYTAFIFIVYHIRRIGIYP